MHDHYPLLKSKVKATSLRSFRINMKIFLFYEKMKTDSMIISSTKSIWNTIWIIECYRYKWVFYPILYYNCYQYPLYLSFFSPSTSQSQCLLLLQLLFLSLALYSSALTMARERSHIPKIIFKLYLHNLLGIWFSIFPHFYRIRFVVPFF